MKQPQVIEGTVYSDDRGNLSYNNSFDLSEIKRVYYIENAGTDLIRGWTGHKVEQRWFTSVVGSFKIRLIKIDDWYNPTRNLDIIEYNLSSETPDVLHVPSGYITAIQSLEENSKLMVMADYSLGEVNDDYRFPLDYFENLK
ncbi:WxcM-like domain-containing protein [Chryseobacterium sp.]|uniref:WxcM-like domain-containing protein n=1 Tax=Chryseobacterium sp. TaxID=1871047 RepID=UPI0028A054B5|nr:WxcM-like domain-containing protein [Chryseobacterium sp.]